MSYTTPFPKLKHFKSNEFTHPELMDERTLILVDTMRDTEPGIVVTINCDFRFNDPKWHGKGKALDLVIRDAKTFQGLPLIVQFMIANRYLWTGIGLYPYWNTPGLHLDTRPITIFGRKSMWWRDKDGLYRSMLELDWRSIC